MAMKVIFFVAVALVAPLASAVSHQELWDGANILKDTINNTAMTILFNKFNQSHVLWCFEKETENFAEFGKTMKEMLENAAEALGTIVGDVAAQQLRGIGKDIKNLTDVFWPMLKTGNVQDALNVRVEIGKGVETKANTWADLLTNQTSNADDVSTAHQKITDIHDEARNRSRVMSTNIGECSRK